VIVASYADGTSTREAVCGVTPAKARPQVTTAMAREAARRLLPHPLIGVAPRGGTTLVNIDTIFWIDSPADVELGTVDLLGYRVRLRAHLEHGDWSFGDGSAATSHGPGRAYVTSDPCRTARCAGYFTHAYRRTGSVVVAAQLSWSGRFSVDGGPWQDIPGAVDTAATSAGLRIREARGVLIPDP
jgi:hypothetical protein